MLFASRRRRRDQSGPLLAFLIGAMLLIALLAVVESRLGLFLAFALLGGGLVYGGFARQRQAFYARQWRTVDRLRLLSGIDFEKHVAELYRRLGYRTEITRGSGDQGVDVIAQNAHHRIGIQCKQWQANVGNEAVQQALAGKVFYNCSHAAVICTSAFTPLARQLAECSGVQLIDGAAYADMVNQFGEEPVRPFPSRWIPSGKPLIIEIGTIAAALLVLVVHLAAPVNFTQMGTAIASNSNTSNAQVATSLASTVEAFYTDINAKRYSDAYALLSPSFQAGQSYANFVQGYATTVSVGATVKPIDPTTVFVALQARDTSPNGIIVTNYTGTWHGFENAQGTWRLDSSGMKRV